MIPHSRPIGLLILALILAAAPALFAQPDSQPAVKLLRLPEGGIHPQAATDSKGRVHVIYFTGDPKHGDIFYIRSDDGKTFTKPLRVNSQADSAIAIGTIRAPQLAIGRDDRVHVAWMGSDKAQAELNLQFVPMLYSRMNDAGDAFEPQRNIIRKHPGLDGGGSVAADRQGNVYVAWHAPDEGKTEADRRVWIACSHNDGKDFDAETPAIADKTGACGCCGMRIAAGDNGRVYILYRTASETVHRNMLLLVSKDAGKTFAVAMSHPWDVGFCVMSTAALAPAGNDERAAWETKGQIYSLDTAASATAPQAMPGNSDKRKHPALAINAHGEYLVAWAEGTGWNKGGSIAWQLFNKDGTPLGPPGHTDGLAPWNVPAAFVGADGTFRIIY